MNEESWRTRYEDMAREAQKLGEVIDRRNADVKRLREEAEDEHRHRSEAEGAWHRWQRRAETAEAERKVLTQRVTALADRFDEFAGSTHSVPDSELYATIAREIRNALGGS